MEIYTDSLKPSRKNGHIFKEMTSISSKKVSAHKLTFTSPFSNKRGLFTELKVKR